MYRDGKFVCRYAGGTLKLTRKAWDSILDSPSLSLSSLFAHLSLVCFSSLLLARISYLLTGVGAILVNRVASKPVSIYVSGISSLGVWGIFLLFSLSLGFRRSLGRVEGWRGSGDLIDCWF